MIPGWRQRWVVAVGIALGAVAWWFAGGLLIAGDGTPGYVVADARVGWLVGTAAVALLGVVAVGMGGVAAATGQPLSGMVVIAASLTVLAWRGGASMGFFWRHDLPGGYGLLLVEAVWWLAGALVACLGLQRLRDAMRRGRGDAQHGGGGASRTASLWTVPLATSASSVAAAVLGAVLAWLIVRTTDPAQVIGGLALSYLVAGGLAYLFTPYANPVGAVISPLIGGVAVYGWLATGGAGQADVLLLAYGESLSGLALALPMQLASAGVLGACLGVALAQGIDAARKAEQAAARADGARP
ncbi:MAG: hypothetical protein AAGK09_07785 [Planctomycetota bacterium]